jgi:O-antigen/teichoic acid export membrane protein
LLFFVKWIANQVLVPSFGLMGSSIATVLAVFLFCVVALTELRRKLPLLKLLRAIRWQAFLLSAIIMIIYLYIVQGLFLSFFDDSRLGLFLFVSLLSITGALVYGYSLIKLRGFTEEQLQMLPFPIHLMKLKNRRDEHV